MTSINIQQMLNGVFNAQIKLSKHDAIRAELEAARSKRVQKLCKRLSTRSSTGDRIRDYVILEFKLLDSALEDIYRELNRTLAGKEGQLILIEYQKINRLPALISYTYENRFLCGVLTLGRLAFERVKGKALRCRLPVSRYLDEQGNPATPLAMAEYASVESILRPQLSRHLMPEHPPLLRREYSTLFVGDAECSLRLAEEWGIPDSGYFMRSIEEARQAYLTHAFAHA